MDVLSHKTVPQQDNILVTASGPSIVKNLEYIKKIAENSTVVSANRNIIPKTEYTVFIDNLMYQKEKNKISNILIVGPKVKIENNDKKTLLLKYNPKIFKIIQIPKISINPNGEINHMCCSAGFAAILSACFFLPKCLYLAGFDGVINRQFKHTDNNKDTTISKSKEKRARQFFHLILSYLNSQQIKIFSFRNQELWGIETSKYNINLI